MQVNVDLSPDVKDALLAGKEKEESTIGKQILEQFYQKTQGEITRSFLSRMITRLESEQSVKEYLDIMDHSRAEQERMLYQGIFHRTFS